MPPPRPGPTVRAGTRRSLDGRSVRPSPPACGPPPSGRSCPRPSAHRARGSHRHATSVSPPPSPGAGSNCPNSSDSRSDTDCSSDRSRTPRASPHPHPVHPDWPSPADMPPTPPTWKSRTAFLTTSACPSKLLPDYAPVDQTNKPQTTRPLRSTPTAPSRDFTATTSRSASAPRIGTQSLTGSARLGHSLSPPTLQGSTGTRLPTFHARAADQAHVAYMPDTTRPISGHPPG